MPRERDEQGRFKANGPPKEKVIRVTKLEYEAIKAARDKGIPPSKALNNAKQHDDKH